MKHTKLFVLAVTVSLFLILTSGSTFARNGFGDGFQNRPGKIFGFNMMEKLDTNGDGMISLQEFVDARLKRGDAHFDRLDKNDDGVISAEEYADRPSKGFIGRREGLKLDQEAFEQCMKDQLGTSYQVRPTWDEVFAATDTNSDGFIDREEFLAHKKTNVTERFAQIDINNDGNLDSDEIDIIKTQMQDRRQIRRSCILEQRELNNILSTQ